MARDQIARLIIAQFKGHGLAKLVDALLRAQGYTTYMSPEGPDEGIDILARRQYPLDLRRALLPVVMAPLLPDSPILPCRTRVEPDAGRIRRAAIVAGAPVCMVQEAARAIGHGVALRQRYLGCGTREKALTLEFPDCLAGYGAGADRNRMEIELEPRGGAGLRLPSVTADRTHRRSTAHFQDHDDNEEQSHRSNHQVHPSFLPAPNPARA